MTIQPPSSTPQTDAIASTSTSAHAHAQFAQRRPERGPTKVSNSVKTKKWAEKKTHKDEKELHYLGIKWYGNVKEAKKYTVMWNMKQIVLRNERQFGRKSWISTCKHLQNGRLRNNKWRVFDCYKQSSFALKRVKYTGSYPKKEGNRFEWKRRKFRLG